MVKTFASILVTLCLLFGISFYERYQVKNSFSQFREVLESLYQKTESHAASYEDGTAVRDVWNRQKQYLHVWLPHSCILEIDVQMGEAVGFLYNDDYKNALPKIQVLLDLSKTIPESYTIKLKNVF